MSFICNQGFEPEWLYTGENFGKVLTTLLAFNFATQGKNVGISFCASKQSSCICCVL